MADIGSIAGVIVEVRMIPADGVPPGSSTWSTVASLKSSMAVLSHGDGPASWPAASRGRRHSFASIG